MPESCWTTMQTPIGELLITGDGRAVTALDMAPFERPATGRRDDPSLEAAWVQLEEYFAGTRTRFDLELVTAGTDFQQRVWAALRTIPYGTTVSYGELAGRVGNPRASRAVGMANNRNPIAIIVPCHRVIGADGSLTGYGGGLDRKQMLLDLEAKNMVGV